ncbi:PREDICTED: bromodomain testis-specific protein-like, partial [Elephantulus edwardii]|uniref:bromodomain testis-specific protein-like n=1 Tax=Elephantulus edwardii TaxID=28737 RepID=UPI0003F0D85F
MEGRLLGAFYKGTCHSPPTAAITATVSCGDGRGKISAAPWFILCKLKRIPDQIRSFSGEAATGVKRKADTTTPTPPVVKANSKSSPSFTQKKSVKRPPVKEQILKDILPVSQQQCNAVKSTKTTQGLKYCNEILNEMLAKKHLAYAWPFYNPVDISALGLHNYYDIIKNPMDLGTIKAVFEMHFANIKSELLENRTVCYSNTENMKSFGRESSSNSSSEDNASNDSEDEHAQRIAKLQEQIQSSLQDTTSVHQVPHSCGIPPNHHQPASNHQKCDSLQSVKNTSPLQTLPPSDTSEKVLNNLTVMNQPGATDTMMVELECPLPVQKDIKIKNVDSWKNLGKPVKTSGVLKSSNELFNQFRKAAIDKEVKARTQGLIQKYLEQNTVEAKGSQENQRNLDNGLSLQSFSNKIYNRCYGEEQKKQQQPLETKDKNKD